MPNPLWFSRENEDNEVLDTTLDFVQSDFVLNQAEPVLDDFPAWSDEYAATMAQVNAIRYV